MPGRILSHSFIRKCKFPSSFLTPTSRPYSVAPLDFVSTLSPTQQSRFKDLTHSLTSSTDPSYVWATYSNLIALLGTKPLPLAIHQQVLRHCTPPWKKLRNELLRNFKDGNNFVLPGVESRFQSLVTNIRSSGAEPNVDDYNFMLSQFASYGHFEATSKLYDEMKRVEVAPDHKSFAYCLRAMAYRLDLPIPENKRQRVVEHVQSLFQTYTADMKTYNVPMTQPILELSLRIMKETTDLDRLENILRTAYAIDLSNLDRLPLEYLGNAKDRPVPFRFTTTTLNTVLDTIGMVGSVSKLVQTFEVLTQPIPRASQHFFNSFESDEEGDFGVAVDFNPPFPLPSAVPNTTSYAILIRHLCRARHTIFARHYLVEALRLHKTTAWLLRCRVAHFYAKKKPLSGVWRPRFQVSRLMLLSVMGEANRNKNLVLTKWLRDKLPRIIKTVKKDIDHYSNIFEDLEKSGQPVSVENQKVLAVHSLFDAEIQDKPAPPPDPNSPIRTDPFDLSLHIEILRRNLADLEPIQEKLQYLTARSSQRVKERLGRRVWQGKDIYLSDREKRVTVTKETWAKIVNFRSEPPHLGQQSNNPSSSRPMSTMAPIINPQGVMASSTPSSSQRGFDSSGKR